MATDSDVGTAALRCGRCRYDDDNDDDGYGVGVRRDVTRDVVCRDRKCLTRGRMWE
jgi:hypothetical protein